MFNYLGGSLQVEEGGRSVSVRGIQCEEDATRPFLLKKRGITRQEIQEKASK